MSKNPNPKTPKAAPDLPPDVAAMLQEGVKKPGAGGVPAEEGGAPDPWDTPAPWEQYYDGLSGEQAGGQGGLLFTVTESKDLKTIKSSNGPAMQDAPLREDAFASDTEGPGGSRVIYSENGPGKFLLTDQVKLQAMEQAIRMYREDPAFRAVVDAFVFYIIGTGVVIKAQDEDPAVQAYLDAFNEASGMDGKDSEMVRRWVLTGEICLRLFLTTTGKMDGPLADTPVARLIPFWRIKAITRDTEDPEKFKSFDIYNMIATATPTEDVVSIRPDQVTNVPAEQVVFYKNSYAEERRGEPPLLVIMRACTWYRDWIKNRVVLNRYRTAFVLFKKVTGTPGRVSGVQSATPDATKAGKGGKLEKRMPKPGTIVTHNQNVEYEWKSPQIEAGDAKEDGRHIRLDICAGAQIPEFILGDSSEANYSSAFVAENPFIRKVEFWRDMMAGVYKDIYARVIAHGIKTGKLKATSTETAVDEAQGVKRLMRKGLAVLGFGRLNEAGDPMTKRTIKTKTTVDVQWPPLLHKDLMEEAQALQIHQSMGLASVETLRAKTGYDHETEERRMEGEVQAAQDSFDKERDKEIQGEDGEGEEGKGGKKTKMGKE